MSMTNGFPPTNGFAPKPPGRVRGRPFEKGQSGNPAGRKVDCHNKTTIAAATLLAGEAEALTRKAVELALVGDPTAMKGGHLRTRRRRDHTGRGGDDSVQTQGIHQVTGQTETSKIRPHRRRPVPMAELGPGLRREDEEGCAEY
jgi:hypothetical protein